MSRIGLLSLLLLAGCSALGRRQRDPTNSLVLCVENATVGYGNVVARVEVARIEVLPGRTVCREIVASGVPVQLTAETTAGGVAGRLSYAMSLPSNSPGCWHWRLGNSQATQADLTPCRDDPRE